MATSADHTRETALESVPRTGGASLTVYCEYLMSICFVFSVSICASVLLGGLMVESAHSGKTFRVSSNT